jgi:hypothetical protein
VFFRLPDLLDIEETCWGQPLEEGQAQGNECPFPKIPSFDFSVKKNGRVTYSATGAFAPNAQNFVKDLTNGDKIRVPLPRCAGGGSRRRFQALHGQSGPSVCRASIRVLRWGPRGSEEHRPTRRLFTMRRYRSRHRHHGDTVGSAGSGPKRTRPCSTSAGLTRMARSKRRQLCAGRVSHVWQWMRSRWPRPSHS